MGTTSTGQCDIVVLISGNGSNLQAIIDAIQEQKIPASIAAVISNRPDAYGLIRAQQAGIATEILLYKGYANREEYDQALISHIDHYQPKLIVLAGFMRILSDPFVEHYAGRMINIHPSLLPKYKGLNTHQRVMQAGDKEHGATVHFVTPELDSGPIILQGMIKTRSTDTADSLQQEVHKIEHQIYPQAVKWFAQGRLKLDNHTVLFDDSPINESTQHWNLERD